MKRYIKTPLKCALPLLCIGVLVLSVSISGCSNPSPPPLTQDQLNMFENEIASHGYTITQHLVANPTGADGSLYYAGQLAKNGSTYDYTIIDCYNSATADLHFRSSASDVQQMGFSGSYSNANIWTGTAIYNGAVFGAGVTEAANSAPYVVIEYFGEFGTPTPSVTPTPTPSVTPTPTPTPSPSPTPPPQVTISFNGGREISHGAVFELSAIVMQGNTPVTTGTVTFGLAGQTYTATQTDSSGIAGRWTSPQFSPITQVGPYTATASYTGPAGTASTTLQITVT